MLKLLQDEMKKAMKAKDKVRLSTIRLLISAVKNEAIAKKHELGEEEIITVIQREIKQRRNAMEDFKKGERADLVQQAEAEIAVLEEFLPKQLTDAEIETLARQIAAEVGATTLKDLGKVMGKLMPQVKGKADGSRVQTVVKKILGENA